MSNINNQKSTSLDLADLKKLWAVENLPDGTLSIKRYKGTEIDITIPNKIGTKKVTAISDRAFCFDNPNTSFHKVLKKIRSITIPDTVTHIGDYAFHDCISLQNVVIPESLEYFGWRVLEECDKLMYTKFDKACYLGNDSNPYVVLLKTTSKSIVSCEIHQDTQFIADDAFKNCSRIKEINIPEGVKGIGATAFEGCKSLVKVVFPNSLKRISYSLLDEWREDFGVECVTYDNALYLGNSKNPHLLLLKSVNKEITSCKISDKTRFISTRAFQNCKSLESIIIPNSVTDIGIFAFSGCSLLKKIELSDSIVRIAPGAFLYCDSLTSITLPNKLEYMGWGLFENCMALESILIPDGVKKIGSSTFKNCTALESVIIGKSVKEIDVSAFEKCENLVNVTILGKIKDIAYNAFKDCPLLSEEIKSMQKKYD